MDVLYPHDWIDDAYEGLFENWNFDHIFDTETAYLQLWELYFDS